jgi:hypothetical protein
VARGDFVGVDLPHRLRVDLGLVGQQQVLARQRRGRAVGAGGDEDAAVEDRARTARGSAAPDEVAGRVARGVRDRQARVEVAALRRGEHAAPVQVRALPIEHHVDFVARQAGA